MTRILGPWSLYRNEGNSQFSDVTNVSGLIQLSAYPIHGANWGDVNNDGWLDLYICNYNSDSDESNFFYLSDGDGTFTECASLRGIDNGDQLSLQAVFVDINFDGWQDLYVINDKMFANTMYLNDGSFFLQT